MYLDSRVTLTVESTNKTPVFQIRVIVHQVETILGCFAARLGYGIGKTFY